VEDAEAAEVSTASGEKTTPSIGANGRGNT